MKYKLSTIAIGPKRAVEITEGEYDEIVKAMNSLYAATFIEERLDLVVENFYEYENELLILANHFAIFQDLSPLSGSDDRNRVIRRIANLLSACRMYIDQSHYHIKHIYGDKSEKNQQLRNLKSTQFDLRLGYRFLESLRNYVQHRGIPVDSLKYSSHTLREREQSQLLHIVVPIIRVTTLEANKKFNNKFKEEIIPELRAIAIDDEVDIRPLIREYVGCIGKIQESLREILKSDFEYWERIVEQVISKFRSKVGDDISVAGLSAVIEDENGKWLERTEIYQGTIKRRLQLEHKNRIYRFLEKKYASNEIR